MKSHYECDLETEGYRLKVTVFSESLSLVELVARQRAAGSAVVQRNVWGRTKGNDV